MKNLRWLPLFALLSLSAQAGVVSLEVSERSPVLDGRSFGRVGPYERIKAKALLTIDPKSRTSKNIVDLQYAPTNAKGLVEFSTDVYILRPAELKNGNGTILFEAPNRGGKGMLPMFNRAQGSVNPTKPEHFGDGLLLEQGYTLVWIGWQTDVPTVRDNMRVYTPVAKGIKGLIRSEYTPDRPTDLIPLGDSNHVPYKLEAGAPVQVTVRDGPEGARESLAASEWSVVADNGGAIRLKTPATPGRTYEAIYTSADPPITGLGAAAVRDVITYLKRDHKYAIGFGISQSAMLLRGFVYEGFNLGEDGHRVFDGMLAHVAGGRRTTFQRFIQMSRTAGPLRNGSLSPTEQFPYTDVDQKDHLSGRVDGILHRARQDNVVPKIFYTNSAYEYWGSGGSLVHTSTDGRKDVPLPETTRLYLFAGGQHGPAAFPPSRGAGEQYPNFNDYKWSMRALLHDLQAWVADGVTPPPSSYPRISDGTAVRLASYRFPASATNVRLPDRTHVPALLDFGPDFRTKGIMTVEPPKIQGHYQALVPQAGKDGNDVAGVRLPEVDCAIAAFTGWNLRSARVGAPQFLLANTGSYIPLPDSMTAHFRSESDYVRCVDEKAQALAKRHLLLPADVHSVVEAAGKHWNWAHRTETSSSRIP